jgi:hypothetical protein
VLAFGANDPGNGAVFTPSLGYAYRLTPYDTLAFTGREQLFYSFGATPQAAAPEGVPGGILSEGHSLLFTWERRLRPLVTMKLSGGPVYVTGQSGGHISPSARLDIESYGRTLSAHFLLAHDLIIGATRAGPLVGDVANVAVIAKLGDFGGGMRAGVYRNSDIPSQFQSLGTAGYTGEISLDYHVTREWTLGVAALRDGQINNSSAVQVDRDVVQMRLTWERFRPF